MKKILLIILLLPLFIHAQNGQYLGAGSATTKLLLHLNGNSTDVSGNGNNGTDANITYGLGNGKFFAGAGFNGTTSKIRCSSAISFTGNFTISFWIYMNDNTDIMCVNKGQAGSSYSQFLLQIINGRLNFTVYSANNAANEKTVTSTDSLINNKWYNIIVTRDGTNNNIYFDGKLSNYTPWALSQWNSAEYIYIGHQIYAGNPYSVLNGKLDEAIIESKAWTFSEITKYVTFAKGRFE